MDWIRTNTFLATYAGIMIVGILGLGFFAFSSWTGASAGLADFDSKHTDLVRLEGSKLHPDPDNVDKVKAQVDAYEKAGEALLTKLIAAQQPLPASNDVTKFGEKIAALNDPFLAKAADQGVIIGDSFYMGMDRYRGETPANAEILQKLEWQLGGIAELIDLTLQAKIESFDQFRRYSNAWEDAAPKPVVEPKSSRSSSKPKTSKPKTSKAPATAEVSEAARVRLRITGTPDAIQDFFNLVANNKKYHFVTLWTKIANETPVGPSRVQDYTPIPVTDAPDAAGVAPVAPANADPADAASVRPAMQDVFPILGSERVRADVLIDIVRFYVPAPEDKPASGKPKSTN